MVVVLLQTFLRGREINLHTSRVKKGSIRVDHFVADSVAHGDLLVGGFLNGSLDLVGEHHVLFSNLFVFKDLVGTLNAFLLLRVVSQMNFTLGSANVLLLLFLYLLLLTLVLAKVKLNLNRLPFIRHFFLSKEHIFFIFIIDHNDLVLLVLGALYLLALRWLDRNELVYA